MPKKNADKIAERRAAREKARQNEKDSKEFSEQNKPISAEEMNKFFESKEMVEMCARYGVVIPNTKRDRNNSWDELMSVVEFSRWARDFSYKQIREENDYPDGHLYMLMLTEEQIVDRIPYLFEEFFRDFWQHEWSSENVKMFVLLHSLNVVRRQVSPKLLTEWKALVGM